MFSLVTFQPADAEGDRLGVMQEETVGDLSEEMASRGSGAQTGPFPAAGDRVRIEIESVGVLEHTMTGS